MDEVAFLEAFLRIPSLSGHERAAAEFLTAHLATNGFKAYIDEAGNAVGEIGEHGPLLVLLGHIDTVPGEVAVRIEHGCLYGRGAVDAKGPFAAFIWAARRVHQAGALHCRLVLIGAVEEEAASSKGAHYARQRYRPDLCVIGEPSGWDRVTLGYKGRLVAHYRHEQPAAHSAGELPAAPERMVAFWHAVKAYCLNYNAGHEKLFEQLIPALRRVASGSDGLLDWVEATLGLRLPEGLDPEELATVVRTMARPAQVTFQGACPAFRSPRTSWLAGAFVRAIRGVGGQPGFLHKTGTADMNIVGPAWGCPIVAYGPGDSRFDHTPDEHLVLDEYQRAIEVLARVITDIR